MKIILNINMMIFHRKHAAQTPKANTSSGPITRSQSHSSGGETDENRAGQTPEASTSSHSSGGSRRSAQSIHSESHSSGGTTRSAQSLRWDSHSSGGITHSGQSIRSKSHSSGGDTDQNRGHSQADTTTTSLRRLRTRLSSREDSSSDNVDQSVGEAIR